MFGNLQTLIMFLLTTGAFAVELLALIDCVRRPVHAFAREGKKTKKFWSILLGVATLVGFLGLEAPLGSGRLGLTALFVAIPAFIYYADVFPAVKSYGYGKGNGNNNNRGGW